jgi:hypothetical protein
MYSLYNLIEKSKSNNYSFSENISLFGCNNGFIPWLLNKSLNEKDTEPYKWNLNIRIALEKAEYHNQTIIINLKPNSSKPNLSLYELQQVWGYSASNWTPLMFHLKGIFIDEVPDKININKFERKLLDMDNFIFSFAYVKGTIKNGIIEGKWIAPRPSSTNSVLLWPKAFDYFISEYNKLIK